ncbi:MAG TPA: cation/multidrug efflux pump [Myxococcota bacterium]|nr:cation/multidrug efflux pump [Myxococcota bacterium]
MKNWLRIAGLLLVSVAIAAAAASAVVAMNLRTYARLVYEQPVLFVEFQANGPQRYTATVTRVQTNASQTFELAGDEWQVDARVLRWHGFANVLGLDAYYRLERVSGRYHDVEQERSGPHSVYSLYQKPFFDLYGFAQAHPRWIPFLAGFYGSATYEPMAPGARYEVRLTQNGLISKPDNDVAREAARAWRFD